MPIIGEMDKKTLKGRWVLFCIYACLCLGGLAMTVPFMIMLTGATSNAFDYERRSPWPRWLWSREDRFLRVVCTFFPPSHRGSLRQMKSYFPDVPDGWDLWAQIGDEVQDTDQWAKGQLSRLADPSQRACLERMAADYRAFCEEQPLQETVLAYDQRTVAPFLRGVYKDLKSFNKAWEVSLRDFAQVQAEEWAGEPIDQPNYAPLLDVRYRDLLSFRQAYRENRFTPYLKGAPAGYLRPASLRVVWEDWIREKNPSCLKEEGFLNLPFPVPQTAPESLKALWLSFLEEDFPIRHMAITVTEERQRAFQDFLVQRFKSLDYLNRVLETQSEDWTELPLTQIMPEMPLAQVWMDFVRTAVPVEERILRDTLPDKAFQVFALKRHKSLDGINQAYGLDLKTLEELPIPFGEALLVTFAGKEAAFTWDLLTGNFRTVLDYLVHRGRALPNTVILVGLSLLITLTVNPLAGYALSRFRLRASEKIIVFCLATMAFPSAVAAIPGFLLLRDLGLLNTFGALVLPGAANGMSIFLLKGFFDSLPQELYEAASIDGAPEWQVFLRISLPLVKPILAVNLLNAFIGAYNGWEWAIIVCQDPRMWTVSVWTYQFYQTPTNPPYLVMAAFVVNSLPVLAVFLLCQKIILRGIILPTMK